MLLRAEEKTLRFWRFGLSAAIHGVLLGILIQDTHRVRVRAFLPGAANGTRMELSYLPGGPLAKAQKAIRKKTPAVVKEAKLTLPQSSAAAPAASAAQAAGPASDSSNNALGNEDIRIALTTYSPSPKPDLSRLPHGAQGEVVLDVTIDPTGQVAELQILQTFGYGVDGAVADTVRTWKFSPATKDGVPVASVQELHFHYGPVG